MLDLVNNLLAIFLRNLFKNGCSAGNDHSNNVGMNSYWDFGGFCVCHTYFCVWLILARS